MMTFKHITVEQVREELANIVARYPDRTGGDPDEYSQKACVYFKDAYGHPISSSEDYGSYLDASSLVIPVCIIGQWVQDFHPELKDHEEFQQILFKNSVFSTSEEVAYLFDEEVVDLLGEVQAQQDEPESTWAKLTF